jgi:DedD protein
MVRKAAPLGFEAKSSPVVNTPPQNIVTNNAPVSKTGPFKYSVQAGSFKDKRNADKLAKKLAGQGYQSYVEMPASSRDKFYRVKVGSFVSKDEALKMASKLKTDGHRIKICTDDVCE